MERREGKINCSLVLLDVLSRNGNWKINDKAEAECLCSMEFGKSFGSII